MYDSYIDPRKMIDEQHRLDTIAKKARKEALKYYKLAKQKTESIPQCSPIVFQTVMSHACLIADNGDAQDLNAAIVMVEKFLAGPALDNTAVLSGKAAAEVRRSIPLLRQNLKLWRDMADT
jgi:hypothetical protein